MTYDTRRRQRARVHSALALGKATGAGGAGSVAEQKTMKTIWI